MRLISERRNQASGRSGGVVGGGSSIEVPDPSNPAQMQAFFLQEVQLGEELMQTGMHISLSLSQY